MKPYHSIETVFVRDKATNKLDFGNFRDEVHNFIESWTISEKIDGTNIRVVVTLDGISIKGRTDNATLPPDLLPVIQSLFNHKKLVDYFTEFRGKELPPQWSVTFYGEGYGAGIQKGGYYSQEKRFRCFDLLLGEGWWTTDKAMRKICKDLGIPTAPFLRTKCVIPETRDELLELFPERQSVVAFEDSGATGILPEGVVAKPLVPLFDTHSSRIMWKLTFREFDKEPKQVHP